MKYLQKLTSSLFKEDYHKTLHYWLIALTLWAILFTHMASLYYNQAETLGEIWDAFLSTVFICLAALAILSSVKKYGFWSTFDDRDPSRESRGFTFIVSVIVICFTTITLTRVETLPFLSEIAAEKRAVALQPLIEKRTIEAKNALETAKETRTTLLEPLQQGKHTNQTEQLNIKVILGNSSIKLSRQLTINAGNLRTNETLVSTVKYQLDEYTQQIETFRQQTQDLTLLLQNYGNAPEKFYMDIIQFEETTLSPGEFLVVSKNDHPQARASLPSTQEMFVVTILGLVVILTLLRTLLRWAELTLRNKFRFYPVDA